MRSSPCTRTEIIDSPKELISTIPDAISAISFGKYPSIKWIMNAHLKQFGLDTCDPTLQDDSGEYSSTTTEEVF